MDIKDAYMDVGGRVMQEQLPSDLFLIFPYRGLYSTDGNKQGNTDAYMDVGSRKRMEQVFEKTDGFSFF